VSQIERRPFLYYLTAAAGIGVVGVAGYNLLKATTPARDASTTKYELRQNVSVNSIPEGDVKLFKMLGRPVYIWHRSPQQKALAIRQDEESDFIDQTTIFPQVDDVFPAKDVFRTIDHEWLVVWGYCTHDGCIVTPQTDGFMGFECSCCSSRYDLAGRVIEGPSRLNMQIIPSKLSADGTNIRLALDDPPKWPV